MKRDRDVGLFIGSLVATVLLVTVLSVRMMPVYRAMSTRGASSARGASVTGEVQPLKWPSKFPQGEGRDAPIAQH